MPPAGGRGKAVSFLFSCRALLQSEAKLTAMYARRSCLPFLSLLPLAQRIELLAATSFSQHLPAGHNSLSPESSLSLASSHTHTDFFVCHQSLAQEISTWLLHTSEKDLLPAVEEMCSDSTLALENFAYERFPVTENRVSMEIGSPGSAFLLVCCAQEKPGSSSG